MILRRYLGMRILQTTLGLTLLLWLIMFARRFGQYAGDVVSGNLAAESLATLVLLRTPDTLALLLPLALFLGQLLACGQLYRNREILVVQAAGLGKGGLLLWALWPALGCALLVAVLSLWLAPWSLGQAQQLLEEERARRTTELPRAGLRSIKDGEMVMYAREQGGEEQGGEGKGKGEGGEGRLRDIFIARRDCLDCPQPSWYFLSAERGWLERDGRRTRMILENGYRYEGRPPALDWRMLRFEAWEQHLPALLPRLSSRVLGLPGRALWRARGGAEQAELQWRISLVLLALVPVPLALALAGWGALREHYGGILAAVVLYFAYLFCLLAARGGIEAGLLAPLPGLWGVHALFALLGCALLGLIPVPRRGGQKDTADV